MMVLSACWLALLIVDLTHGLTYELAITNWVIWGLFAADAALEFFLAPRKGVFVRRRWLTLLSVALPAVRVLRMVRVFRAVRAARSVRLIRLLTSVNRNLRVWRGYFASARVAYVIAITAAVIFSGAAGMFSFENPRALRESGVTGAAGLRSYPEALWWTAMVITTMGSEYWPKTPEGRVLCFLLSLYAFSVFGYVTASLASFFLGGRDRPR